MESTSPLVIRLTTKATRNDMIVLDQNKFCISKLKQNETQGMKKMDKGKIKD